MSKSKSVLFGALGLWCGCLAALWVVPGKWVWLLLLLGAILIALLKYSRCSPALGIMLLFFALGLIRTEFAADLPKPPEGTYRVIGTVQGEAKTRDDGFTFTLCDVFLDGEPANGKAYCTLHFSAKDPPELFDGARIAFEGKVYHAGNPSGPAHFDFSLWLKQNGIGYGITSYKLPEVFNTRETAPVRDIGYRFRCFVRQKLTSVMGESAETAMALLFGDKSGMPEDERAAYQTLGIAHVISASGLQIMLFAGLLTDLMMRLRIGKKRRAILIPLLLLVYSGLTGFGTASLRAIVIIACARFANVLNRHPDRITSLALAMTVILLFKPLEAGSAGFLLSFSAALFISLWEYPIRRFLMRMVPSSGRKTTHRKLQMVLHRHQSAMARSIAISVSAQAGILLPAAAVFHRLPLYGILVNVLLISLVGQLLIPFLAALIPLSLIPWVGGLLGSVAAFLTGGLREILGLLSKLPFASVRVASPPVILCIGIVAMCVILSRLIPGSLKRKLIAAGLCLSLGVAGMFVFRPAELRYIQLDVGQADSALILNGRQTLLVDTGANGQAALDILLDEGRDIDALYLTHLHSDHAGGISTLLDGGIRIRQVYMPIDAEEQLVDAEVLCQVERLRAEGIPITYLAAGDKQCYGNCSVEALWPVRGRNRTGQPANDRSMAMMYNLNGCRILNAADVPSKYEAYYAREADILKVPHHGSASSAGEEFLQTVSPKLGILTVSSNGGQLPSGAFLNRAEKEGLQLLRTASDLTFIPPEGGAGDDTP